MQKVKNLVVGAGITGAVIAERLASKGEDVLIIDQREHVAGNCYDYRDTNGICIHKYGSHIFHTNNREVWDYVTRFSDFNTYMHTVVALVDGIETSIPFNLRSLYSVFPQSLAHRFEEKLLARFAYNTKVPILEFRKQDDPDLRFLADYIYEKIFLHYTAKQWGVDPERVDSTVTARVPVYISCTPRYFQDTYQGIPQNGYEAMINNMLRHSSITIKLGTRYTDLTDRAKIESIFYTGSIDEFFNYKFGVLPYRSVSFKLEEFDREFYQSGAVVNYPCNYTFTRIHEYKYYLGDKIDKTVIAKEYSEAFEPGKNDRYYPIPSEANQKLYEQYLTHAQKVCPEITFVGRLGEYRYYDMDKAVERGLAVTHLSSRGT